MRQPEITKEKILRKSGHLFNTQGYRATSISDITAATGLTKGAIYRHFNNKDELETETLLHLSGLMFEETRKCIVDQKTAPAKLKALFKYFESYIVNTPLKGGCPLLNAATEADDSHPALRKQAVIILDKLHAAVVHILDNGIRYDQLKKNIDKDYYASLIIASLEGAIMMGKLRGNNTDMTRVVKHLNQLVKEIEL
jgi:TetR/AcrR family transcriptional regulator, transcriptional repressor for nem operon